MRLFRIFLASPSDTEAERHAAEEAVDEINKSIGYDKLKNTYYKTRSRICNKLGINVQEQLNIDQASTIKKNA